MDPRKSTILYSLASLALAGAIPVPSDGPRRGYGCRPPVESIRKGVARRRAKQSQKSARKRNRK